MSSEIGDTWPLHGPCDSDTPFEGSCADTTRGVVAKADSERRNAELAQSLRELTNQYFFELNR